MFVPRAWGGPTREVKRATNDQGVPGSKSGKKQSLSSSERRALGWRPDSYSRSQPNRNSTPAEEKPKATHTISQTTNTAPKAQTRVQSEFLSRTSTPVAVPSRRGHGSSRRTVPGKESGLQHDPSSGEHGKRKVAKPLPASVAAVLETTAIPTRRSFPKSRSVPRQMTTKELMDEWNNGEYFSGTSLTSSPTMELLLSPPQSDDQLLLSESSDSFAALSRSSSSDSVPSLGPDESSNLSLSLSSTLSTPHQRKLKGKIQSPRQRLEHDLEHPLSPPDVVEEDFPLPSKADPPIQPLNPPEHASTPKASFQQSPRTWNASHFKSNLTTSLNNLRNSIRSSLSNFSAPPPYILPEDHLYRGFFNGSPIPIHSEMRPRPFEGPVTPEMRRYMNPSPYHVPSPGLDFHLHCHGRYIEHLDLEAAAASYGSAADEPAARAFDRNTIIPLQTYESSQPRRYRPALGSASSGGPFTEAGRATALANENHKPQYRRELRENGEFLRICILEMNMRRAGKLADGPGRAKLWLPPRSEAADKSAWQDASNKSLRGKHIPSRWIPISA